MNDNDADEEEEVPVVEVKEVSHLPANYVSQAVDDVLNESHEHAKATSLPQRSKKTREQIEKEVQAKLEGSTLTGTAQLAAKRAKDEKKKAKAVGIEKRKQQRLEKKKQKEEGNKAREEKKRAVEDKKREAEEKKKPAEVRAPKRPATGKLDAPTNHLRIKASKIVSNFYKRIV